MTKVVFFGDSITGNNPFDDGTDKSGLLHRFPEVFSMLSDVDIINAGMGGNRMAAHRNEDRTILSMFNLSGYVKSGDWSIAESAADRLRMKQSWIDFRDEVSELKLCQWDEVKAIIISFGDNDFRGDVPIDDFIEATKKVIKELSESVTSRLIFITPLWSSRDGGDAETNNLGLYLSDYVDSIIEVCEEYSISVYDLYRKCGVNEFNAKFYLKGDGVHPTVSGSALIAEQVAGQLRMHGIIN